MHLDARGGIRRATWYLEREKKKKEESAIRSGDSARRFVRSESSLPAKLRLTSNVTRLRESDKHVRRPARGPLSLSIVRHRRCDVIWVCNYCRVAGCRKKNAVRVDGGCREGRGAERISLTLT
jgi:hypothetical protein